VNAKRVYRLYREEAFTVLIQRRRKLASHVRVRPVAASPVNDRWSTDFGADPRSGGGKIRVLTALGRFTRECLALKIAQRLRSRVVTDALDKVIAIRGKPRTIQVDNGSELTSNHFDAWAYCYGIHVDFIRPGKPVDDAHIGSFNGRLRDECSNARWFESVDDARQPLQAWRMDCSQARPHSPLGDLSPAVFTAQIPGLVPELRSRDGEEDHQAGPTKGSGSTPPPFDLDPRNLAGSI